MKVLTDPKIPKGQCVIADSNGTVIYAGLHTAGPNDTFLGGLGDSITVHPSEQARIKGDCDKADLKKKAEG